MATADLVLEGGGVKGIALVGAIEVLEEAGYAFSKVAGTSAGAIVGALVAAGYRAEELRVVMNDLDYRRFRDPRGAARLGPAGKALALALRNGIYEGAELVRWLDALLAARDVVTFGDLHLNDPDSSLPPDRRSRLVVMASDVGHGRLRRLPWDYGTCYDLDPAQRRVTDAVRASMSIPFFYRPARLDYGKGRHVALVDGGMLSNFPVGVFDRPTGEVPRWPTFGIKLSARPEAHQPPATTRSPVGLALAMLRTMTGFHDHLHVDDPAVLARTIFVDTTGVRSIDFDIDRETSDRLYRNGRDAAQRFLDHWDWDAHLAGRPGA